MPILISFVTGFLLFSILWGKSLSSDCLLKAFFSVGLGLGMSSCVFFVCLVTVGEERNGVASVDLALLVFLAAIFLLAAKNKRKAQDSSLSLAGSSSRSTSNWESEWVSGLGFLFSLGVALVVFRRLLMDDPHGGWDAWAIWNLRARFLFRGGDHWKDSFSNYLAWSHPDYPLLIPAVIARGWNYLGNDSTIVPGLISALFTFGTVGLLYSSLLVLRGKTQACLAGMLLLSTPIFVRHGASQYADVPLAFFILACTVLVSLRGRVSVEDDNLSFLIGMTAGFAAWTKNEGLLFLLSLMCAHLSVMGRALGWKNYLRKVAPMVAGLSSVLVIIVYFKVRLAPSNYMFQQMGSISNRLQDYSRYFLIAVYFGTGFLEFGRWFISAIPLLLFYALVLGTEIGQHEKLNMAISLLTLSLTLTGYFLAYVITPSDLRWQLNTSLSRLILQIWPSLIFVSFLVIRTPDEALAPFRRK